MVQNYILARTDVHYSRLGVFKKINKKLGKGEFY